MRRSITLEHIRANYPGEDKTLKQPVMQVERSTSNTKQKKSTYFVAVEVHDKLQSRSYGTEYSSS